MLWLDLHFNRIALVAVWRAHWEKARTKAGIALPPSLEGASRGSLSWSPCVDVSGNSSSLSIPTWTWSHSMEKTAWRVSETVGKWENAEEPQGTGKPTLHLNFQFHESINMLMVQTKESPVLFLALKNLSIWFIIQPHYPSSSPCMLWLGCVWGLNSGNGVTFFLCEMSFHGILWIWSPQTIRLIICSLACVY